MTSAAGSALTALHYRQQLAIKAAAIRDAHALWQHWTPGDLASWKRMVALAIPLIAARHALSAATARRYFESMAAVETGDYALATVASSLPEEQIAKALAATGLVGTFVAKSHGLSMEAAQQVGFVRFQGGVGRLAMEGGRDTITESVAASSAANGWTRVTGDAPCEFCQGLADETSTPDAFQAHDNCSCTAEPSFV